MKIGILTYHFAINYGAVLQCYALQRFLQGEGHEVEIINFIPKNFRIYPFWANNGLRKKKWQGICGMWLKYRYSALMISGFDKFRDRYLNLSDKVDYDNFSQVIDRYDAVITGSDQVWGPSRLDDLCYFFDNTHEYPGLKISYAPCCAVNEARQICRRKDIAELLREFYALSVRNLETQNFVFDLIGRKVPIVSDPTLLCDFAEFMNGCQPIESGEYILTYILGADISGGNGKAIEEIKKNTGINTVISIVLTQNAPKMMNWPSKIYYTASPTEWLNLFFFAKFIFTDSYHGVMFALNFKKPFVSYYREKSRAARFIDLRQRFGMENIVNSVEDLVRCMRLGKYRLPYIQCMESNIMESKEFLRRALKLEGEIE